MYALVFVMVSFTNADHSITSAYVDTLQVHRYPGGSRVQIAWDSKECPIDSDVGLDPIDLKPGYNYLYNGRTVYVRRKISTDGTYNPLDGFGYKLKKPFYLFGVWRRRPMRIFYGELP